MWKNGIGIIQRFPSMPRIRNVLANRNHEFVAAQVANGVVGEKAQKVMQFATNYVAFVAIRMSHVGIWGIEAFALIPTIAKK